RFSTRADAEGVPLELAFLIAGEAIHGDDVVVGSEKIRWNFDVGTMTIAGLTFTVNQAGAVACTFAISPTRATFQVDGGTGSVSVTAPDGCAWTAASNATWITITSGASGNGDGTGM